MVKNIVVIGGSGAIGQAFTSHFSAIYPEAKLHVFSRSSPKKALPNVSYHHLDYQQEVSIEAAAKLASQSYPFDKVLVTTGILHHQAMMPEKSLRDLTHRKFIEIFEANTIFPALVAKHFLPKMNKKQPSIFAALSARVGSISDNHLGGWYSYRASKAALNMILKTAAIEIGRQNKQAIIVGLHPGTVDSALSKPFQARVPQNKLFTPSFAVKKLCEVLDNLTIQDSGKCFAWDGKEIEP